MTEKTQNKTITLRERKKAQPKAVLRLSEIERGTIKETVASTLDQSQFNVFIYTCQALGLNPLLNEICAVPYKNKFGKKIMSIQVMRDGFLTIAHRSGKFAGLESDVKMSADGKTIISGWAKVYAKGFEVPVKQEAYFEEYKTSINPLWASKPKTMIIKVAESMALRKAFNVNGVYSPEEMDKEIMTESATKQVEELVDGSKPATEAQITTIKSIDKKFKVPEDFTKQDAVDKIRELTTKK